MATPSAFSVSFLQWPGRSFLSADGVTPRPLLRQIVHDVGTALPAGRVIISGTGLSKSMVDRAVSSQIFKLTDNVELHNTGSFDNRRIFNLYIQKYLGPLDEDLLDRLWNYLRGR
jgi:hypothetical protein